MATKGGIIATLVSALAALIATPAKADLRQFGNVIFPIPPGWTEPRGSEGFAAMWSKLPDDRCEYCRILVGHGEKASGSLTDWLERNRFAFVDDDDRDGFEILKPAEATTLGQRDAALLAMGDGSDMLMLVAIKVGDRYELAGFDGNASDVEELTETQGHIGSTFLPWLRLLRFRSEGAPSLLAPPVRGQVEGLWWCAWTTSTPGIDMVMRMDTHYRRISFWRDGTFFDGTPPQGTAAPDRAALDAMPGAEWGNYRVEGDGVLLSYADGRSETLKGDGDGVWSDGTCNMSEVEPLPDGSRLDGGISSIFYTGFIPGSGIEGGVSASSSTTFHRDGRYSGSRFGGSFGNFAEGGGFSAGSEDGDGGTYEIRDGLLIFSNTKGEERSAAAVFRVGDSVMVGDQFFKGTVR